MVTGQDVADFLGQGDDTELVALAGESVPLITAMAKSYTRDGGFNATTGEPNEDVAAVITTAAARLVTNPGQLAHSVGVDDATEAYHGGFTGWSLVETFVLNRYRRKAM